VQGVLVWAALALCIRVLKKKATFTIAIPNKEKRIIIAKYWGGVRFY